MPGQIYVTRRGDTLKSISKRAYGTIDFWPDVWTANLDALNAPEDMKGGLKLKIPPKPSYR